MIKNLLEIGMLLGAFGTTIGLLYIERQRIKIDKLVDIINDIASVDDD